MTDLTPTQALVLFRLLALPADCRQADIMPAVTKGDREALIKARMIGAEKIGRGLHLKLEDAGWAWTAAHLNDAVLPPAQGTLAALLRRLDEHLKASGKTLADFIGSKPTPPPPEKKKRVKKPDGKPDTKSTKPKPISPTALRKRIEAAYLAITGNRKNESVRLWRLRAQLSDLDRGTVDAGLARILQGDKKASLLRHDDPRQLEPADHEAAFSPWGEPLHVIWIAS